MSWLQNLEKHAKTYGTLTLLCKLDFKHLRCALTLAAVGEEEEEEEWNWHELIMLNAGDNKSPADDSYCVIDAS